MKKKKTKKRNTISARESKLTYAKLQHYKNSAKKLVKECKTAVKKTSDVKYLKLAYKISRMQTEALTEVQSVIQQRLSQLGC
jgi:hypothetical protein